MFMTVYMYMLHALRTRAYMHAYEFINTYTHKDLYKYVSVDC